MGWSALFDQTHIIKGVPVDAQIELQCKKCKTLFYTTNAYYIGYSEISYANSEEKGQCIHGRKSLEPTNNWLPTREIHKEVGDGSLASLFDYSHILDGVPIDADIELQCKRCKRKFYTKNAYYVGYSGIFHVEPAETGKCDHDIKNLKPTKRYYPITNS